MLLNNFSTPLAEGSWRALLQGVLTFAGATLIAYQANLGGFADPERIKEAAIAGAILALAPFAGGVAIAAADQSRASQGQLKAADVPVAAVAQDATTLAAVGQAAHPAPPG